MGLEYKIETYDVARTNLPQLLRERPEFLREEAGMFHLGSLPETVLFSVKDEGDYVYVCERSCGHLRNMKKRTRRGGAPPAGRLLSTAPVIWASTPRLTFTPASGVASSWTPAQSIYSAFTPGFPFSANFAP